MELRDPQIPYKALLEKERGTLATFVACTALTAASSSGFVRFFPQTPSIPPIPTKPNKTSGISGFGCPRLLSSLTMAGSFSFRGIRCWHPSSFRMCFSDSMKLKHSGYPVTGNNHHVVDEMYFITVESFV